MTDMSFGKEWNDRAGFVAVIAVVNPIILTVYSLIWHRGAAFEFWLIGMALTFAVCLIAGSFMLLVIITDRNKRFREAAKSQMWADALPYDPAKSKTRARS
jgi:Na+/H+ antiporter NhaC